MRTDCNLSVHIICAVISDGISVIVQRVKPSIIFCDADVLQSTKEILNDIELNAKLFTVNGSINGIESIDSLVVETGREDTFVYVISKQKEHKSVALTIGITNL